MGNIASSMVTVNPQEVGSMRIAGSTDEKTRNNKAHHVYEEYTVRQEKIFKNFDIYFFIMRISVIAALLYGIVMIVGML